jgi:uroporphyrinogen-III synthase
MRVWVTRTAPEAESTAARLRALGHAPLVAPVLQVRESGAAPDLRGAAALAFTSSNGVRAFARLSAERGLPVYAVGDSTARAARAAGFSEVRSAAADVAALVRLILDERPGGAVVHLAPEAPAGDLVGGLKAGGVEARLAAIYRTEAVLPEAPLAALSAEPPELDVVLVHSARAARALAERPELAEAAPRLRAVCISRAAAAPLLPLNFASVAVAPLPTEGALLNLLGESSAP